jgi:hypothetical protein
MLDPYRRTPSITRDLLDACISHLYTELEDAMVFHDDA